MDGYPDDVRAIEMFPRDGLQSLEEFVSTETKIELIDALSQTGVDEIEFTAFVHPDAVPNLRDAEAVAEGIDRRDDVCYRALVPNAVGMKRAIDAGVDKVNALISVSETYSRKNQNTSPEAAVREVERIVELGAEADVAVEAGISASFYCPYEGRIRRDETVSVVGQIIDAGVDEVTLATTMGLADPKQVSEVVSDIYGRWPDVDLGLHLHDTNGMSLANTLVALDSGVDRFDTAVCGVGGGVGNTPTEDILHMLSRMGIDSDERFREVSAVAERIADRLDVGGNSHVVRGGTTENVLEIMRNSG